MTTIRLPGSPNLRRFILWNIERGWKTERIRAMLDRMMKPKKKPEMSPRELRDGTGWFVFVSWGDWPAEQVGGFPSEEEAQQWIDRDASNWIRSRFEERPTGFFAE